MKTRPNRGLSETLHTQNRVTFQKELFSLVCNAVTFQKGGVRHKTREKRLGHMPVKQLLAEVRAVFPNATVI
jgi:hypothetical protein